MSLDTNTLFAELRTYIADCNAIVARGEYLELDNMDKRVEALCAQVMQMTPEESQSCIGELETLMGELNALQELFKNSRNGLAEELSGVAQHQAASKAYNESHVMASKVLASTQEKNTESE